MELDRPSQGSPNTGHSIDLSGALRRLRGDHQLLRDLISFFLEDYSQVADDIHRAAERKDPDDLALAAHSLKGLAANFDAHQLVEVAGTVEQHAKGGNLPAALQLIPSLDASLERLAADLRDFQQAHAE
jgi:HPt (histidine-containing phosphotransfer) domain-containing protein